MAKIDAITKAYIRKNEVFADAFNYFMYNGVQKILPDQLKELDSTEIAILLNEKNTSDKEVFQPETIQKYRDHLKSAAIMEDDKNKLADFIYNNSRMDMEIEAARVIEAIACVKIDNEEVDRLEKVNVCKAIADMIQDGRDEGKLEGFANGRISVLSTLIQSGKVTVKEAAAIMGMTQEEFIEKSKTIS